MKKLTPIAISLCLLGLTAMPGYAAHRYASHQQSLEQQVAELRQEIQALKGQRFAPSRSVPYRTHHVYQNATAKYHLKKRIVGIKPGSPTPSDSDQSQARADFVKKVEAGEAKADATAPDISGPESLPSTGIDYIPIDFDVPGQSFVSTGPYIGTPLQYSGSDLIVNNPSVNQDVALLNLRKNINKRLCEIGRCPESEHSHLLLSGVVEGQINYKDRGKGANSSDIDITSTAIDAYILGPSTWTSGLISLNYDNGIGAQVGSFDFNSRTQNSRVFINKAFIVIGNFSKSPWYFTLGQMYVPFGQYSSTMVSSPLTKLVFRTQARAALFGYQQQSKNAFYASIYAFNGDTRVGQASTVHNGGINFGYKFAFGKCFSGNVGGGAIANVADSQGMQNTGNGVPPTTTSLGTFGGFGAIAGAGNEVLIHRVPGYNVRGLFSFGKTVDVIAEYLTASTSFSRLDMTMKSHGAKPQALNTEIAYTFQGTAKPLSISAGYGMTKDALALGMPMERYSVTLNTSFWRNTLQSLEFRRDINYAASAASSGSSIPGPVSSGRSNNVVTAQFDLFF